MVVQPDDGRLIGGRYLLVHRLGAGGFGQVWKARDQVLDLDVAVKQVLLSQADSDVKRLELVARAAREARNAAKLRDHPNIVAVHDVVIEDGVPWTVMRLVTGRSLAERLEQEGPLGIEEVAGLAVALLRALGTAHLAGIVHRDVKPGNVMLASDGGILLTDFGIAVALGDTKLTASGAVIGSWGYAAPERMRGEDRGAVGDLFSLGATLYQAVEGRAPFRHDIPTAVVFEQAPPLRFAGRLAELITSLLEKDPDKRPAVAQALKLIGTGPTGPGQELQATESRQRAAAALESAERLAAKMKIDGCIESGVFSEIVSAWAVVDSGPAADLAARAEHLAAGITKKLARALWLAEVSWAWASVDLGRAADLAAIVERIAVGISGTSNREQVLIRVARTLAAKGSVAEAERVATSITGDVYRALALVQVSTSLVAAGLVAEAERVAASITMDGFEAIALMEVSKSLLEAGMAAEAERIAYRIKLDQFKALTLALVASAWTVVDPGRAAGLVAEAERVAVGVADGMGKGRALAGVAKAKAAVDLEPRRAAEMVLIRAETVAADITDVHQKELVLADIAEAWAATGLESPAMRVAARITDDRQREKALVAVAKALAAAGLTSDAERVAIGITKESPRATALTEVAKACAAIDPDRAERVAAGITIDYRQVQALVGIAKVWLGAA